MKMEFEKPISRLPSIADAEFVACMEDVLDIYELPYNPDIPVVCMDEKPYQFLGKVRESWAMRPVDNPKIDTAYFRNGSCNIFTLKQSQENSIQVSMNYLIINSIYDIFKCPLLINFIPFKVPRDLIIINRIQFKQF